MKTLTELSGSVIRVAAAAIAEARRAIPETPAQGAGAATGEAPAQTVGSVEESAAIAAAPVATPAPPAPTPPREAESGAAKEAIDAAVAKATGVSGDRLAMLLGALEAAGRRTEEVRLVRVFGLEEQLTGATKVGDYQYVVDLFPRSMQQSTAPRDDRGQRGGRGGGRGDGGGRGGGDRGSKGSGVGGFSMDSLREDRKNERGGRGGFGGGGRSGGGGRGGGSGGPPGGGPKK